ncbi:hypothetical protein [Paraburkholderia sp.]|uniref:hypothetical protein n=1 Tax=Paraburkholderia sp. TaxID=1926495 RepID=UPI002D3CFAF8|nr:hypothetical protein [Paraburkholderia sp.]HZZ06722.1 hypothetical protein [Paraburkholderia sp.]
MLFAMPADWWRWSFGAGLSFIFLWLISVPAVRGERQHAGRKRKGDGVGTRGRQTGAAQAKENNGINAVDMQTTALPRERKR